jgi:two-component system phosphate regulon sensor histidine kinase PhoR
MHTYELISGPLGDDAPASTGGEGLRGGVLLHNARWFTRIRWVVVAVLLAFGLANVLAAGHVARVGLLSSTCWPWGLAAILVAVNVGHITFLRRLSSRSPRRVVAGGLWMQIIPDLGVLTVLVYEVGPFDTPVAFGYLFHIVLACIFFPPRQSFLVVLVSTVLFLAVVVSGATGVLPIRSIVADATARPDTSMIWLSTVSVLFIWFVTWYLVTTLARVVRERDQQLAIANEQLAQADRAKTQQVLRVTHDLKAPFSGIETNIHALRYKHWEQTPEPVRDIIRRIEARSATLRERIRDILSLGELRGCEATAPTLGKVDLCKVFDTVIGRLDEWAEQRHVTVRSSVPPLTVLSHAGQLTTLFANLLSNAIAYSDEGGRVEIVGAGDKETFVRIIDHGIGVHADAMPHIFEEYYRADEATGMNRRSTGLGLSIVKQIAENLMLRITVASDHGSGTTFTVWFPAP